MKYELVGMVDHNFSVGERRREFEAPDDEAAIKIATKIAQGSVFPVWTSGKLRAIRELPGDFSSRMLAPQTPTVDQDANVNAPAPPGAFDELD